MTTEFVMATNRDQSAPRTLLISKHLLKAWAKHAPSMLGQSWCQL